jgi:branched-chain amino acid transport system substrate-binding protein
MNNTKKITIGAVIIVVAILAGTVAFNKSKTPTSTEPIKIGFIGALTGDAASYGEPIKNSIELAVIDVNSSGGINGRKIEMIYEDAKCSGKDAVSAVQKLINIDKVKIIIGGICSGEILSVASITESAKVLILSPGASSPDVTQAGDFVFRNIPSDSEGSQTLAKLIMEKYKTAAIISENSDYAQGNRKVFTSTVNTLKGTMVADENYAPGTTDFRSILTKIKATNPDALVINPQTEIAGATIINQARELGIIAPIYGTVIVAGSKTAEIAGANAEGMIVFDAPGLREDNTKAVKFLADYTAKYGKPSFIEFYLGAGNDAVYIMAQAISKAGTDTEKLRDYLYDLKSYNGVIGTYSFDENGDLTGIGSVIKIIKDGKAVEMK